MTLFRLLIVLIVLLFGSIVVVSSFKKGGGAKDSERAEITLTALRPIEIEFSLEDSPSSKVSLEENQTHENHQNQWVSEEKTPSAPLVQLDPIPDIDRIQELFNKREPKLPIVETITYRSHVPWLKGKSAWISDYAAHYRTSRHFIARSLNGKPDYEKQDVKEGDRFNVFNEKKSFEFYLLADLTRCKMWFYYIDNDLNEKVLLKSYPICVGREDAESLSGSLTPIGKYSLGDKIAVYRPRSKGIYKGEKTEMMRIFGTRWIPFKEELEACSSSARGLGIHGLPLSYDEEGRPVEQKNQLGKWESDGCIRLSTQDMEELFSIIISRPATIEIVRSSP